LQNVPAGGQRCAGSIGASLRAVNEESTAN
jgi:hypothetical protein